MGTKTNRIYIYRGRDEEYAPRRTKEIILHKDVTVIKEGASKNCTSSLRRVSAMGDKITKIESYAFFNCKFLRYIKLSRNLECIAYRSFYGCRSLEAIFLPSGLQWIENEAFALCPKLSIFCVPETIRHIGEDCIPGCIRLASTHGGSNENQNNLTKEEKEQRQWNRCHRYDKYPLHKICYDTNVCVEVIHDCVTKYGEKCASVADEQYMTVMHIISANPHADEATVTAVYDAWPRVVTTIDEFDLKSTWKWILEAPGGCKHAQMAKNGNGANYEVAVDKYGSTAIHYLCEYNPALLQKLKWLKKASCCFHIRNKDGLTPLQILIKNSNIAKLPIEIALKCNVKWRDGMECIVRATRERNAPCLLERDRDSGLYLFMSASIDFDDDGCIHSDLSTIYELLLFEPDIIWRR